MSSNQSVSRGQGRGRGGKAAAKAAAPPAGRGRGRGAHPKPAGAKKPGAMVAGPSSPSVVAQAQGPQPASTPVQPTANTAPVARTYVQNALSYSVMVKSDMTGLGKRVKDAGYEVRINSTMAETNNHGFGAAMRQIATSFALGEFQSWAQSSSKAAAVVDMYGSARTLAIHDTNKRNGVAIHPVVAVYRPVVTNQDILRAVSPDETVGLEQLANFNCFLFVDVYATHHQFGYDEQFTPKFVFDLIKANTKRAYHGRAIWIGHRMSGLMGVVDQEGAWIRDGDRIRFRPDRSLPEYPAHSPCDWLWQESGVFQCSPTDYLSWAVKRAFGSLVMVEFAVTEKVKPGSFKMQEQFTLSPVPILTLSHLPTWLGGTILKWAPYIPSFLWDRLVGQEKIWVYMPLWAELLDYADTSSRTSLDYSALLKKAKNFCADNDDLKLLREFFPFVFDLHLSRVVTAAFSFKADERLRLMQSLSLSNATFYDYNESRKALGTASESWTDKIVHHGFTLLGVLYSVKTIGSWGIDSVIRKWKKVGGLSVAGYTVEPAIEQLAPTWWKVAIPWVAPVISCLEKWNGLCHNFLRGFLHPSLANWFDAPEAVKFFCVVFYAPVIEELIKRSDYGFWILMAIEAFTRAWNPHVFISWALLTFPMHLSTRRRSYWDAVRSHMVWNLIAWGIAKNFEAWITAEYVAGNIPLCWLLFLIVVVLFRPKTRVVSRYEKFRTNAYEGKWENRLPWDLQIGAEPFASELSMTPTQEKSCFALKPLDRNMVFKSDLLEDKSSPYKSVYWWLLPTNVAGYVPMRSNHNLNAVVLSRLMRAPPMEPEEQLQEWKNWFHLVELVPLGPELMDLDWIEPWLEHFDDNAKKRKYRATLKSLEKDPMKVWAALRQTRVMVKTDEMLMKLDDKGEPCMNPRAIANVAPEVQVCVGPQIFGATKYFKDICHPLHPLEFKVQGLRFSVAYAGAATDMQLSKWWRNVTHREDIDYFIIVSGDDSLVYNRHAGLFYEGDASMFDQSQSKGPLFFEYRVLRRLGVDREVIELLYKSAKADYVGFSRDKLHMFKLIKNDRPMRDTGGSDTSLGNSIVMAFAWVIALIASDYRGQFKKLGIDMKLREWTDIERCTFLKGMWYRVQDDRFTHFWGPLPSRILKAGKSLKDPRTLYRKNLWNNQAEAALLFLNDLAHTWAYFMEVPLLRTFIKNFKRSAKILDLQRPYKILASPKKKPIFDGMEQLCLHYNVPAEWFLEVEKLYPTVPFVFIEHPLFNALQQDYA